jgi:hypothetical protein
MDVDDLNTIIRTEIAAMCRLLLVFSCSQYQNDCSSNFRENPVSLLSLMAHLRGDRISCSLRPMRGEPLVPVFEGVLVPAPSSVNPTASCRSGTALLTAELHKPFNHRPFLCKVAAQLRRLPMSPPSSDCSDRTTETSTAHHEPSTSSSVAARSIQSLVTATGDDVSATSSVESDNLASDSTPSVLNALRKGTQLTPQA